ncbi:uncharacterized protein LOC115832305 [Nomascus leucogenys]|uniref:uncharacterized protein LOC115832305 n=1 Tax=Nomascus leucogenys TaxID=61853 RepID=UPI00122D665B|nr:uncharacterized protein LOC115832305 [Nomascus leucogenys]
MGSQSGNPHSRFGKVPKCLSWTVFPSEKCNKAHGGSWELSLAFVRAILRCLRPPPPSADNVGASPRRLRTFTDRPITLEAAGRRRRPLASWTSKHEGRFCFCCRGRRGHNQKKRAFTCLDTQDTQPAARHTTVLLCLLLATDNVTGRHRQEPVSVRKESERHHQRPHCTAFPKTCGQPFAPAGKKPGTGCWQVPSWQVWPVGIHTGDSSVEGITVTRHGGHASRPLSRPDPEDSAASFRWAAGCSWDPPDPRTTYLKSKIELPRHFGCELVTIWGNISLTFGQWQRQGPRSTAPAVLTGLRLEKHWKLTRRSPEGSIQASSRPPPGSHPRRPAAPSELGSGNRPPTLPPRLCYQQGSCAQP